MFDYLEKVGANFPEKDPIYNKELEAKHLHKIATKKLKSLEKQRLTFLRRNFDPNNNWWGSLVTKD